MTSEAFDNQFDVLYNSITSNQAPSLDAYEKSVFLTQAQTEILLSYFDPRKNKVQEGYDDSQRRQIDFSGITRAETYTDESKFITEALYDPRKESRAVNMPVDIMIMLNERVKVTRNGKTVLLTVVPISYDAYDRLMSKPYKRPVRNQAWRIFNYSEKNINTSDLVVGPGDKITEYSFRYVKRPRPIIVGNLDGLEIEGYSDVTNCELDPILHYDILQRAVENAKAVYSGNLQEIVSLGNVSKTEIGTVPQARQ